LARLINKGKGATVSPAPSLSQLAQDASALLVVVDYEFFREQALRSPAVSPIVKRLAFGTADAESEYVNAADLQLLADEVQRRAQALRTSISLLRNDNDGRSVHVRVVVGGSSDAKTELSTSRRRPHVQTVKKRVPQLSGDQFARERGEALRDLATSCAALGGRGVRETMLSAFLAALGDGHVTVVADPGAGGRTSTPAAAPDVVKDVFNGVVRPVAAGGSSSSADLRFAPAAVAAERVPVALVGVGATSVQLIRAKDHADAAIAAVAQQDAARDGRPLVVLVGPRHRLACASIRWQGVRQPGRLVQVADVG
jgi:hypothetical protein